MLHKIGKNKYKINEDFKEEVDTIISNLTNISKDKFTPYSNDVLVEELLPRLVADKLYTVVGYNITDDIQVTVTYGTKSYIITMVNRLELRGIVYNIL